MRIASFAEWTISWLAGKHRATSMVGDLVEIAERKGSLWFCIAVAAVVIRLLWRPLLAFVAAFYVGNWVRFGLSMATIGIHAQHRPPQHWMRFFYVLLWAGSLLSIIATYLVIRFGLLDRFARLAAILAGLTCILICLWWQPAILVACAAICLDVVWLSLRDRGWLRAAFVLVMACSTGFCSFMAALFLESQYQRFVHPGPIGSLQEYPSLMWVSLFLLLAATFATTAMCSFLRNWAMGTQYSGPEVDDTVGA